MRIISILLTKNEVVFHGIAKIRNRDLSGEVTPSFIVGILLGFLHFLPVPSLATRSPEVCLAGRKCRRRPDLYVMKLSVARGEDNVVPVVTDTVILRRQWTPFKNTVTYVTEQLLMTL